MNQIFWRRTGRLWIEGGLLLLLRLWQNRAGFDAVTGLAVPSIPGKALAALLVIFAVLELVRFLSLKKEKQNYTAQFAQPDKSLPAAVAGCLLLVGGGAVLLFGALAARSVISVVAGVLGMAAGAGLLFLLRQVRAEGKLSVLPVLPAMFFGVFLVLEVYLPTESDPVLARSCLPVLATAMTAYAFSQLGGFLRAEGSPRAFLFTADLAVPLCLAAVADGDLGLCLLYVGCALTLSAFLLLCREGVRRSPPRRLEQNREAPPQEKSEE